MEDTKLQKIAAMEKVLEHPSGTPERWRAAFDYFLAFNPDAKADADEIAKGVAEKRWHTNKFASTKNGRLAYSTPNWLLRVLKNTDPEYFEPRRASDFSGAKHLSLMKAAFPEYFYAEVI